MRRAGGAPDDFASAPERAVHRPEFRSEDRKDAVELRLGIDKNLDSFDGIDIYKRIMPYKNFLKLENCKQKTIEKFLKIDREDKYSGSDLIGMYHLFVSSRDAATKDLLLLHNFEDVKGMLTILPVLAFSDLFNEKIKVTKVAESKNIIPPIVGVPAFF